MRRRRPAWIAAACLMVTVGTGCAPSGTDESRRQAPSTFVVGVSAEPDYLNPIISNSAFSTRLQELLFLRLAEFGPPPDYAFVPQLAESWELSDDGLDLTYRLRTDVTWHDGVPTTAHDVVFTFDLATNEAVAFPERGRVRRLESWEALDDRTVRFRFRERSWEPIFDTQIAIVPKHLLADVPVTELAGNGFSRRPVGNGPWKLRDWVPEQRVVLEAYDGWHGGRPAIDRLVFRIIPEETTLRTELLTGGVHLYDRFPNKFFRQDSQNPELEFQRFSDRGYVYIGWNHARPMFADPRVRRALTLATDRRTIIDAFRDGFGEVSAVPLFQGHPDFHPDLAPLPFDPGQAARLLDEAGWTDRDQDGIRRKDGRRLAFKYMLIANNEISEEIATLTHAQFRKLGIEVTSEFYEWTVYLERLRAKRFDATILSRVGEMIFDPEDTFHSRSIPTEFNDISFGSAVTDSLIDLAKSMADRSERRRVWWRFQEEFQKLQPITVLYVSETSYPVRRGIVDDPIMDLRGPFYQIAKWHPVGKDTR
ncbi:MAG: peptide-binding protein [Gemmatimonadota bacterium]|nr:MAG: peptide-binding protein [Gemmatimonadota bacterium]